MWDMCLSFTVDREAYIYKHNVLILVTVTDSTSIMLFLHIFVMRLIGQKRKRLLCNNTKGIIWILPTKSKVYEACEAVSVFCCFLEINKSNIRIIITAKRRFDVQNHCLLRGVFARVLLSFRSPHSSRTQFTCPCCLNLFSKYWNNFIITSAPAKIIMQDIGNNCNVRRQYTSVGPVSENA